MKPLRSYTKPHSLRLSSNVLLRSGNGETKESLIVKKFTELNEAYVRLIGLDEVKRFQDRVIVIQVRRVFPLPNRSNRLVFRNASRGRRTTGGTSGSS